MANRLNKDNERIVIALHDDLDGLLDHTFMLQGWIK